MTKPPDPDDRMVGVSWVAALEAWIEAGRPKPQTMEPATLESQPAPPAPTTSEPKRAAANRYDGPPLVVIFKYAAHRGIHDQRGEESPPSKKQARKRRKSQT